MRERGFGKEIRKRHEAPLVRGVQASLTDLGMIDRLYNLICEDGHRAYSSEQMTGQCGARTEHGACTKKLGPYENSLAHVA